MKVGAKALQDSRRPTDEEQGSGKRPTKGRIQKKKLQIRELTIQPEKAHPFLGSTVQNWARVAEQE